MNRKLATVETIIKIDPILNADAIEVATVRGWKAVIRKGEFTEGQKIIFCEIDSVLPMLPEYEFLRSSSYVKTNDLEGFRIKTVKLRGQISQGLILKLENYIDPNSIEVGTDVTNELGIKLWEPYVELKMAGNIEGKFPHFIPTTSLQRVQNLGKGYFTEANTPNLWEVTEKLDGTSFTCYKYNGHFGVCSRNWELTPSNTNLYWNIASEYEMEKIVPEGYAIQGEIIGPKIQGNPYKLQRPQLFGDSEIP